jgi:hypothetical protein
MDVSSDPASILSGVTGFTGKQIGAKILKQDAANTVAVATMASKLPVNPNLGRHVNTTA